MTKINKVAVIGSGVMGSGIAAHLTNAGLPVVLLDIKVEGKDLAKDAVEKMLKADPAPFMRKSNAKMIETGTIDDDMDKISDCDWIIEVVVEKLEIKHATYEKIQNHRKKDSIVSSNTSTIPLYKLTEGQPDAFKKDFMITHFFNPPRYMRLLELVVGEKTDPKKAEIIQEFCDIRLGKGVVKTHDTPGFIANRLGVYWLTSGINEAINQGVSIELADAVLSRPVGIPKTGIFGLIDLVGIDLMPKLSQSLLSTLPKEDSYHKIFTDYPFVHQMIEQGYTGRKGQGGFYRLDPNATTGKVKQALNITKIDAFTPDTAYINADRPSDPAMDAGKQSLRAVLETDSAGGKYARAVLLQTLAYAASLVGEIADTVFEIDEAMKLGYNWKQGPFEMIDALGAKWFAAELEKQSIPVPAIITKLGDQTFYKIEDGKRFFFDTDGKYYEMQRAEGILLLSDLKLIQKPIMKNGSASVWDIGDGVLCFEKTSKMNSFDEQIFQMLEKTIATIENSDDYKALVIYNEGSNFSVGANLGLALFMVNIALFQQVEQFVAAGQKVFMDLKHSSFPVVGAPSGMALGGGCEILLASNAVQAHAETYTGLVEVGVGVIPGWGGCKEMILRLQEREREQYDKNMAKVEKDSLWFSPKTTPMGAPRKAFETIGTATVAKSAFEAQDIGYFRYSDDITFNRDRLLYDAKQKALAMAKDFTAPEKLEEITLPGPTGKLALDMAVADLEKSGKATPYDVVVSDHLARVLTGGDHDLKQPVSEDDILDLEREQFLHLLRNDGTIKRIETMLDTGKPLRN